MMFFGSVRRLLLSPIAPPGGGEDSSKGEESRPSYGPIETRASFTRSIIPGARELPAYEAQQAIQPGMVLFGRYLVMERLGRGGMGQVWHVRHVDLNADRALKMLVDGYGGRPEMSHHFRREARVMASFTHPHAVTIHDARFANDMTFIDMELLVGRTLADLLREDRARPLDWTARILEQLCDVLQAAHDRGIIHRDIKPWNIMMLDGRPQGREFIKLLDFGLASVAGQDGFEAGQIVGTPGYMSPEQLSGEQVDHRGDLYSLGSTIYEMLAGRIPYQGSNIGDLFHRKLHELPPSIRIYRPDIPEKIDEIILACLGLCCTKEWSGPIERR